MTQSLLIKTPTGLSPAHDEDFEALKGLKVGEVIKVNRA